MKCVYPEDLIAEVVGTRNHHQVKEHWRILSGYYKERSAAK